MHYRKPQETPFLRYIEGTGALVKVRPAGRTRGGEVLYLAPDGGAFIGLPAGTVRPLAKR